MRARSTSTTAAAIAGTAAAALLALAGCGGSSASRHASAAAAERPALSTTPIAATDAAYHAPLPAGRDRVARTSHHSHQAKGVEQGPNDEASATAAKTLNPCTLVTQQEAGAILHKAVTKPVEAPQGPTCIYRAAHSKAQVTLAVQSSGFPKSGPVSQLHSRMTVKVRGRTAYCGVLGSPRMVVPLAGKRYLIVGAACPIAAGFAGKALSRLKP